MIELWCRTRAGNSLLLLVSGMRPFLEVALPGRGIETTGVQARLNRLKEEKEVTLIHDPVDKWTDFGEKPHWKVEVTQPYVVPRIRDRLATDWEVSSADILFVNRLFFDRDLGPHIKVEAEVLWASDSAAQQFGGLAAEKRGDAGRVSAAAEIRARGGKGLYPVDIIAQCEWEQIEECEPFEAPYVILSFDLETSIAEETILCAAAVVEQAGERSNHTFVGSEREIMAQMTRLVRETDPDIITGYNIDNFDLPRLKSRQQALTPKSGDSAVATELFGWGRLPATSDESTLLLPKREQSRTWRIPGRCVLDAWWQARMALRPQRETLAFVSRLLWPDRKDLQKMDIDSSRMDEEWAARPDEVLEYCLRDALLPLEILHRIRAVERKEALATVARTPLDTAISGTTSQWLGSLAIRLADRNSIAIPRTRRGGRAEKIEGGYVHDVESGLYPWIAVLDFKSMYPSIMIHNNICYTTRIDALRTDELPQGIEAHESPSGARFLPEKVRRGIVPQLLQKLMLQRDAHKQLMRAAKVAEDIDEMYFHDRMQAAVKVLMNSFYGVFASAFYRFTHPQLGAAITAWARSNIKELIAQLESEGIPVVYSDTDSLFASAPVAADAPKSPPDSDASSEENAIWQATVAQLIEFGTDLATRLSDSGAELEFETGLAMFFSHGAKKRYFGRVVWPEPELLIRGYETRRTDSFDLLTATMMEVFEMILNDDSSAAVQHVIELIRSLRGREVDPSRLIISRGCKGRVRPDGSVDFSVYDNPDGLPFVQAARKRLEQGLAFTPGMKVGWVVTNARNRPMVVEPWIESETGVAVDTYDPEFYANRLAIAMGRITDAFGWSSKDLLSGTRQATFDFF